MIRLLFFKLEFKIQNIKNSLTIEQNHGILTRKLKNAHIEFS